MTYITTTYYIQYNYSQYHTKLSEHENLTVSNQTDYGEFNENNENAWIPKNNIPSKLRNINFKNLVLFNYDLQFFS